MTMYAPRMGSPVIWDPSVYMKSARFHDARYGRIWGVSFVYVFEGMEGYGSL